eukprot:4851617-Amphidinium_carterae.1
MASHGHQLQKVVQSAQFASNMFTCYSLAAVSVYSPSLPSNIDWQQLIIPDFQPCLSNDLVGPKHLK